MFCSESPVYTCGLLKHEVNSDGHKFIRGCFDILRALIKKNANNADYFIFALLRCFYSAFRVLCLFFSSIRAPEVRGDQGVQLENLEQRCVKFADDYKEINIIIVTALRY